MLDPVAEPQRAPHPARGFEGVERVAVGQVSDCVDGDRPAGRRSGTDDLGKLAPARDPDA